jgi:hypothetical protein
MQSTSLQGSLETNLEKQLPFTGKLGRHYPVIYEDAKKAKTAIQVVNNITCLPGYHTYYGIFYRI